MAPDKFEKYIKEKMRQREIAPSEEAWDKISAQLPAAAERRKKPLFWYSIAASFVGILFIGLYLIQSPNPELDPPEQIVAKEKEETREDTEVKKEPTVIPTPDMKQVEMLAETPVQEESRDKAESNVPDAIAPSAGQELAAAETISPVEQNSLSPSEVQKREELIIKAKITEVVAEVRLLEMNSEVLTEAEVDSLLRKAQTEILKERIFSADRSVDAMALLNEVEEELDQSFRDQIFDRLKAGFNKVRTAVADRNN